MRVIRHPLVARDLVALVDHLVEATDGDFAAANRRLDEIDALVSDIIANPMSGMRLAPPLDGWLARIAITHDQPSFTASPEMLPDQAILAAAFQASSASSR